MNELQEIVILIKQYLQESVSPNGFWDNVVEYVLPIFSMLVVIIGGIWTVYTYVKGKNKEANEKILEEVYLPLFQFFVINDSLTQIGNINIDYKEEPFLVWSSKKTTFKMEIGKTVQTQTVSSVMGLSRESFIESIDKINLGLSPKRLVALLSAYKAANYAVDNFIGEKEIHERAIGYRSELEYALRVEAYKGYKKYHKKLGLMDGTKIGFSCKGKEDVFQIYDDHIQLNLNPLPEQFDKTYDIVDGEEI